MLSQALLCTVRPGSRVGLSWPGFGWARDRHHQRHRSAAPSTGTRTFPPRRLLPERPVPQLPKHGPYRIAPLLQVSNRDPHFSSASSLNHSLTP